ncbi:hypothetical protein K493DRAFT_270859 [Basidiobolus meristosporus CBS 931.73]|uniref:DUF726-domain-containing protein n=1 Tax=Basidiobolus meristosporus CBS 931.73 TaxID=1314790 RepID=A0A1Y1X4R4_9FUNG|nr:hypothetical protein K493DRAFT_270859 [Basidiobolus meristosporus CBS 931.73]|eukprot:ORX80346.1 hypothetical protein K493DRAFT_270859 [Basidiobolus meristosporus CBS 931.73]
MSKLATSLVALPKLKLLTKASKFESEVTVYVKGFLAQGEDPEDFNAWLYSHRLLLLSPRHHWGGLSYGYSWPSGTMKTAQTFPFPIATLSGAALLVYRSALKVKNFRFPTPATVVSALALDAGLNTARLAYQYHLATEASQLRADLLAEKLVQLRREHTRVRIVGHSLGCGHLLAAVRELTESDRPDVIHLCAPAVKEETVKDILASSPAKEMTYCYYTDRDLTLAALFRVMAQGSAMGEVGLSQEYPNLKPVDVSNRFGMVVHTKYARKFHHFAEPL